MPELEEAEGLGEGGGSGPKPGRSDRVPECDSGADTRWMRSGRCLASEIPIHTSTTQGYDRARFVSNSHAG